MNVLKVWRFPSTGSCKQTDSLIIAQPVTVGVSTALEAVRLLLLNHLVIKMKKKSSIRHA